MRLGIDIGGTFTDFVLHTSQGLTSLKVPTTSSDHTEAVLHGLKEILSRAGVSPNGLETVAHGTTVATNAMLEGTYARGGLLTTQGFRDLLEIGRQRRPSLYDLFFEKQRPLVPRSLRREVNERILSDGTCLIDLDPAEVIREAEKLVEGGIQAIAVCLLHSYANPDHELKVKEILAAEYPQIPVWTSSEVLPEYREFERFSTTVANAVLGPVMSIYLERFEKRCRSLGIRARPFLMQSNGGVVNLTEAGRMPARSLLSGPAAGVLGAIHVGRQTGVKNLITFDMGGTSCDVSLVRDGKPLFVQSRDVAGFPVRGSSMDVNTIGAGGGSLAWVDSGGRLRVGPRSAGAVPGPAAYGRGGSEATVTDANVVTGRLGASTRLAGHLELDIDASHRAVESSVGGKLGMDSLQAALGILRVVNTNMALAARAVSVARGHDPRDYALLAYGGAGPLHAVEIARELGVPKVIVPNSPGTLCALGLLVSDLRAEFTQTQVLRTTNESITEVEPIWRALHGKAQRWCAEQSLQVDPQFEQQVDARYIGQHHEITVPAPSLPWAVHSFDEVLTRFYQLHEQVYGYAVYDEPVEIVTFRLIVTIPLARDFVQSEQRDPNIQVDLEPSTTRPVLWAQAEGFIPSLVLEHEALRPGSTVKGPAIIEQVDSTVALPPGAEAHVDAMKNLLITPGS